MTYRLYWLFLLVLSLSVTVSYAQTKPLTNDDIVQMVKGGFDEQTIIKAIHADETAFDTSVQSLLTLKNDGVSKPIIDAMLESTAKKRSDGSDASPTSPKGSAALLSNPAKTLGDQRDPKPVDPAIYVEEVSSQGGVVASSDTALEAIKSLQEKHIRVVTIKEKADYILQVTRQLGKKSWKKDTKIVLSNRNGDVVLAKSTRTVGGAAGDVVEYIHAHHE
jgi:hypothetical protein